MLIEQFSIEYVKTESSIILAKENKKSGESIKTRRNFLWLTRGAGKSVRMTVVGFGAYFRLDDKIAPALKTVAQGNDSL